MTLPKRFTFPRALTLTAIAALPALTGCVSDEPRRSIPDQPAAIQPTTLGVWATAPKDTDANGYLDTVDITVYVSTDQHPVPIQVPGSFNFRLIGRDKKDLAKWRMDEAQAQAALRRSRVGPGYFFALNINEVATDQVEAQSAELAAEFVPRAGKPVQAPLTGLRFGRIRTGN